MKVELVGPYESEVIDDVRLIREFESGIVLVTDDTEVNVNQEYPLVFEIHVEL